VTDPLAGPWVLVVGMHRSGTSAVAGALVALGLNSSRLDDRMDWPESNPEHWESLSLGLHNENLLVRFDGEWDAPPELPDGWELSPEIRDVPDPVGVLVGAYPEAGPSVWKDPRLCLLLPYWRSVLPAPIAAVFVWRSPLAVAQSLMRRDELPIAEGLALWERYNRSAIEGLEGVDTYVIGYESLVGDPVVSSKELATWLRSLSQFRDSAASWDPDRAAAAILGDTHHPPGSPRQDGRPPILAEQKEIVDYLSALRGGHSPLVPKIPVAESLWTNSVLRLRSKLSAPNRELDAAKDLLRITRVQLESTQEGMANLRRSTSWRITGPLRSLTSSVENLRRRQPDR
jgi:hypothetical protein